MATGCLGFIQPFSRQGPNNSIAVHGLNLAKEGHAVRWPVGLVAFMCLSSKLSYGASELEAQSRSPVLSTKFGNWCGLERVGACVMKMIFRVVRTRVSEAIR